MRKLMLTILLLAFACTSAIAAPAKNEVAAAIKANPQIVFDALNADKAQFLDILEAAIAERDSLERQKRFEANVANPLEPSIDTKRPHLGPLDAPITIVEYSDFLCAYCGQGSQTIQELLKRYPGQIRVFFKHYPAKPGSIEPAAIFEALGMQSKDTAWKFAELAFANQGTLVDGTGKGVAAILATLKADYKRVKKESEGREVLSHIEDDVREAKRFGIDGTPTFLINGIIVRGAVPIQEFESIIGKLRAK